MKTYKAIQNNVETTAKKINGRWLVGGDRPWGTISILLEKNEVPCWFRLKGSRLIFEDVATPEEIDNQPKPHNQGGING